MMTHNLAHPPPMMLAVLLATALLQQRSVHGFFTSSPHAAFPKRASPMGALPTSVDTLTSGLASMARLMAGVDTQPSSTSGSVSAGGGGGDAVAAMAVARTKPTLVLWDAEHDAECRAVREELTRLDLCVELRPCAAGSLHWSDLSKGGAVVPVLADEAAGVTLHGGPSVLSYLRSEYGQSPSLAPSEEPPAPPPAFLSTVASALRLYRGAKVSPAAAGAPRPSELLILYSYEGNQFCRLVREALAELDLKYVVRSAGKGSARRAQEMVPLTGGSSQCPFLVDPNTGVQMAESAEIIEYLYRTYALWTPPSPLLRAFNNLTPILKPIYAVQCRAQAAAAAGVDVDIAAAAAAADATDTADSGAPAVYDEGGAVRSELEAVIAGQGKGKAVVVFTYALSPFCLEATTLLQRLGVDFEEVSLGQEWPPGFIADGSSQGSVRRAVLLDMTGQSSLPHVFVGGEHLGGLFSGPSDAAPGLVPSLEAGDFMRRVPQALAAGATTTEAV